MQTHAEIIAEIIAEVIAKTIAKKIEAMKLHMGLDVLPWTGQ